MADTQLVRVGTFGVGVEAFCLFSHGRLLLTARLFVLFWVLHRKGAGSPSNRAHRCEGEGEGAGELRTRRGHGKGEMGTLGQEDGRCPKGVGAVADEGGAVADGEAPSAATSHPERRTRFASAFVFAPFVLLFT